MSSGLFLLYYWLGFVTLGAIMGYCEDGLRGIVPFGFLGGTGMCLLLGPVCAPPLLYLAGLK